jgi:hypothetical protein
MTRGRLIDGTAYFQAAARISHATKSDQFLRGRKFRCSRNDSHAQRALMFLSKAVMELRFWVSDDCLDSSSASSVSHLADRLTALFVALNRLAEKRVSAR